MRIVPDLPDLLLCQTCYQNLRSLSGFSAQPRPRLPVCPMFLRTYSLVLYEWLIELLLWFCHSWQAGLVRGRSAQE